ncbi:hexose transporter hxt1 [Ascosphaera acerosa]|nr:hexose transporter hxt1 [Ascosphaera acerosa]
MKAMLRKIREKVAPRKREPTRPMTKEDRQHIEEVDTGAVDTSSSDYYSEKGRVGMSHSEVPLLTPKTVGLGILASMGGFIFGYDTGQISGFIAMKNFKQYFGSGTGNATELSDVRAGLIVSL